MANKKMMALLLMLVAALIVFVNPNPAMAGNDQTAAIFEMDESAACGDYVYKIMECDQKKDDVKIDVFNIKMSVMNNGLSNAPIPPMALVSERGGKQCKAVETMPSLESRSSTVFSVSFNAPKNDKFRLKVSGDSDGILTAFINLFPRESNGPNELIEAARKGDAATIKALLKKGVNPNMKIAKNETPLMLAALSGNRDAVKALLDKGASIKDKNLDDEHAIYYAIESENYDTIKLLLERGSNTWDTNSRGKTPYVAAKAKGNKKNADLVKMYSDKY